MQPFSSLRYLEIDEEGVKQRVYEAFTERFGEGFVKKIFIGKYPGNYGVVVYLENKKNLTDILQLSKYEFKMMNYEFKKHRWLLRFRHPKV